MLSPKKSFRSMNVNSLYIELTNQCNFRCETCYNRSGLHAPVHLPWDTLRHFLDQFSKASVSFSGGEPSLYPERDALIGYIETHPDRKFSFITNGSMDWILPHYARLPNLHLQVSLDGSCEEINALTRGAGHFETTASFIRKAAALRPMTGKMVINSYNHQDAESFYRWVAGLGCRPLFSFATNMGTALSHWESLQLTPSRQAAILQLLESLNAEYGMDTPLPYATHHCPLLDPEESWNLLVTPDGHIQPCQSLYDAAWSLGTLEDSSALEERAQQLNEAARMRLSADYGCQRCWIRTRCDHGCPALALNYHADFHACDEQCELRRQQFLQFVRRSRQ